MGLTLKPRQTVNGTNIIALLQFAFLIYMKGKYQPPGGTRFWINLDEVEFVLLIYYKLVTMYLELKSSSQLAIISPYSYEVKTFKDRFKEMFGVEAEKVVDINTVDCFQGREKDVAIFLCVRANEERGIGFVSDFRRMNVGITRAKSSILVVGSAATLRNDEHWKNLIESAEQIDQLFKVSEPWASFFSNENPNNMRVVEKYLEIPDTSEYEEEASPVPVFRGMLNKNRWMAETIETAIKIKTKEASANTRHAGFYILPFW